MRVFGGGASCLGVGRPGWGALPPPTARPLGGLPGPTTHWLWVRGGAGVGTRHPSPQRALFRAGFARCGGGTRVPGGGRLLPRCAASGVGRSPTSDCPPSGRAAGAHYPLAVGAGGCGRGDPSPTPQCALFPAGFARCGGGMRVPGGGRLLPGYAASGVGRSPTPDCPPSGRAAGGRYPLAVGAGGRGRGDPSPAPQRALLRAGFARCGGGMRVPARGRLLPGCRASGVGRSPSLDCPPSGRAAGAHYPLAVGAGGCGRGDPSATPQRALLRAGFARCGSGMRVPARGRLLPGCGASGVGRSPTPDCPPSGRAAGAHYPLAVGAGGCGRGDPSPTPQRALLRAGFARCGSGMRVPGGGASCLGVGRPGSGALPPPTARPLGGLPGPTTHRLWVPGGAGVGTRHQPNSVRSFELALRAVGAARGRPGGGASCLVVGRPGSGALPAPTARPLGGLPGPTTKWLWVWGGAGVGTRHQTPQRSLFRAGFARCGGCMRAPGGGGAFCLGVGRPGSGALPPPTARPLGGLLGPTTHCLWVRGGCGRGDPSPTPQRVLFQAGFARCGGGMRVPGGGRLLPGCGASGVGPSPTPNCPPSGWAAGAHHPLPVGAGGCGRGDPSPNPQRALSRAGFARCEVGMRVPAGGASCLGVGRPGSGALPPPTARPSGGLPGCCACTCPAWPRRAGRRPRRVLMRLTFHLAFLASFFACSAPSGLGLPCLWLLLGFFFFFWLLPPFSPSLPPRCVLLCVFSPPGCLGPWRLVPPPFFFVSLPPPSVRPVVSCFACFPGPWRLVPPPPSFFLFLLFVPHPPPPCCLWRFLLSGCLWPLRPPPPFFFLLSCWFFSCCASAVCVLGCRAVCSVSCSFVVLCASYVLFLVAGVVGSWCRCLLLGVCWWLWLPGVVVRWCVSALVPVSGLAVAGRPLCGVPVPCAVSCGAVLPCGAVLWCPVFFFFFVFLPAGGAGFLLFSVGSGLPAGSGSFLFLALPVRCCAVVPAPLLCVPCSLALTGLAGVSCCYLLCLCVCCWAWLSSVVSWWVLVAPGVVSRWRAVVCPSVLCCAVLLRVVPPGVALLCAVLFRFAPSGAATRCPVSWGAVLRLWVLCLLAPCFVLSPRAVCVLLWCVAAWCCPALCFVPCAPWGVVLCVSCRLRPVRCCCVARAPSVPCFPVLFPVVLCCRVVPWCPVLPPCWVCFLRGCGCTYLKNSCKIS